MTDLEYNLRQRQRMRRVAEQLKERAAELINACYLGKAPQVSESLDSLSDTMQDLIAAVQDRKPLSVPSRSLFRRPTCTCPDVTKEPDFDCPRHGL